MFILSMIFGATIAHAVSLCGKEAQQHEVDQYTFAIVGNTIPMDVKNDSLAGRVGKTKGVTKSLLKNVGKSSPDCVVFVGDMVKSGSKKDWKRFEKDQLALIPELPVQPVIGEYEALKDTKYTNTEYLFSRFGNRYRVQSSRFMVIF